LFKAFPFFLASHFYYCWGPNLRREERLYALFEETEEDDDGMIDQHVVCSWIMMPFDGWCDVGRFLMVIIIRVSLYSLLLFCPPTVYVLRPFVFLGKEKRKENA